MAFNQHTSPHIEAFDEMEPDTFEQEWNELVHTAEQVSYFTKEHSTRTNYHLELEPKTAHIERELALMECRTVFKTRIEESAMVYFAETQNSIPTDEPDEFGVTIDQYSNWFSQSQTLLQPPYAEIKRLEATIEAIERERTAFNVRLYRNIAVGVITLTVSRMVGTLATIKDLHKVCCYSAQHIREAKVKQYAEQRIAELQRT